MLLKLLRAKQWYKNIVVFIPIVFAKAFFTQGKIENAVLAFFSLCLISSCNYIINDIVDLESDKKHPEKKLRPVASGKISVTNAIIIAFLLLASSLAIAYIINSKLVLWPISLFVSTLLYSLFLKKIPVFDVHVLALNFIIRTTMGSVAVEVPTSAWLYLLAFLLALFLGFGKRYSELKLTEKHDFYSAEILEPILTIIVSCLLGAYFFYTFMANPNNKYMMLTIPLTTIIVFRYYYLIKAGNKIARQTELIFIDKQILFSIIVWTLLSFIILYKF